MRISDWSSDVCSSDLPDTADAERWHDVDVSPGRLFVVGDPKQSIYRFRRADIATILEARERFAPEAGGAVELTANYHTGQPTIGLVNRTFRPLKHEAERKSVVEGKGVCVREDIGGTKNM